MTARAAPSFTASGRSENQASLAAGIGGGHLMLIPVLFHGLDVEMFLVATRAAKSAVQMLGEDPVASAK